MTDRNRSIVSAIRWPVTLITLGVLFVLNNFTQYGFEQTWPVLLIVFGLLSLLRRSTEPTPPPRPAPYGYAAPGAPFPPPNYQAPPTPPGTAKGGFGTSAPPRTSDSSPEPESGSAPPGAGI